MRAVTSIVSDWKAQMGRPGTGTAAFDFGVFQNTFTRLQREYREEYELYGLGALAVAVVAPVVRSRLADWRPLEEPARDVELFRAWRALLQTGSVAGAVSAQAGGPTKGYVPRHAGRCADRRVLNSRARCQHGRAAGGGDIRGAQGCDDAVREHDVHHLAPTYSGCCKVRRRARARVATGSLG